MGQIFYNMGFLSTNEVNECSASDLIAPFVGQTAPKTIQVLEKALGQVLFIDEAYRLGEGGFAAEALNELVDSLTKPRFMGKMIVVLAGYEDDINRLLSMNQGLSSRFSEEVTFRNMASTTCWTFLQRKLAETGITIVEKDVGKDVGGSNPDSSASGILGLFSELSAVPSWGNGRDVETISKTIIQSTFRSRPDLTVTHEDIQGHLRQVLQERQRRATTSRTLPLFEAPKGEVAHLTPQAPPKNTTQSTTKEIKTQKEDPPPSIATSEPEQPQTHQRDDSVTAETWAQLQADKKAQEAALAQQTKLIADLDSKHRDAAQTQADAAEAAIQAENSTAKTRATTKSKP